MLLTLPEAGRGSVRKIPNFAKTAVQLAFVFMGELGEDSMEEWSKSKDDEDLEFEENFQVGLEAIDRLALSLGGKLFLAEAIPIIKQWLGSGKWVHRHAALMVINCLGSCPAVNLTKIFVIHFPGYVSDGGAHSQSVENAT